MPSPETLDIEALLVPIPGEDPAGEYLIYEGSYDTIKKARQEGEDRDALEPSIRTADWSAVIKIAAEATAAKSKDLQIAVWLAEALVKDGGFVGLRDGLRLLRELQQRFWASLHPAVVDGDLEDRARLLEWLDARLPLAIRQAPLTHSRDGQLYSWLRWEESRSVDNLGRQNQEAWEAALADGKITGEQFDKAVAATPRAFYEALLEDLTQCQEEYEELDSLLNQKFGREAPSLLDIKSAIEDCSTLVEGTLKRKRELEPEPMPPREGTAERGLFDRLLRRGEGATSSQAEPPPDPATLVMSGVPLEPRDRADALRRLGAVADYFRKTEPHSPVAYLVERAIRWGEMPLEQWLKDVIGNDEVLGHVRETLGLKESDTSEGN
jgi:type VI secretion system protein ImpA